ncbi:hypothetical protein VSS37_03970 [Candidatus Thiothrix sp. Deng01]|uniref:Integrase n=1 Tax=Candidatus Thiothrix phosphatis TaxID=3112415 RepID=A0ABU6CTP2_9GAMM|nr:hypothetical protein [Candidatus Thiothrix sp. Deng01]MEB4590129.1 hypothetical protein [Candidatus Thiothrix sp. Deng01]
MARPRKVRSHIQIPYVHESYGAIVYRPYIPPDKRAGLEVGGNGLLKHSIRLGTPDDDPDDIYRAYLGARESLRLQIASARNTLGWIVEQYLQSRQFIELAPTTQKRAHQLNRILEHPLRINGHDSTLAALHITNLTQPLLHQIADKRLGQYQRAGRKGVVQVNRETTFLSTALGWACNYIPDIGVTVNPLRGYKKIPETPADRYVSDGEYRLVYEAAASIRPWLQPLMEMTYLMATRGVETLDIRLGDCTEEGIRTRRRKGSRSNLILWSERLRAAYHAALALHEPARQTVRDPWLFCRRNGEAITRGAVHTAMQKLKEKMEAEGQEESFFNLHALKAKGVSDSDDKKIAGHKTESMRQRYDRAMPVNKPVK